MKILLMGPQGCGKGTVGVSLSEKLGIPYLSAGELLREIPQSSPHYKTVNDYMEKGELVPEKLVASILDEELSQIKYSKGFILDGWGRQLTNIQIFNPGFDLVLLINISYEESVKRITGRRICDADGKNYNIYTLPPEELKNCKGNLIQREDDTEEVVKRRQEIYETLTSETITYFRQKGILVEVDGMGSPEEVLQKSLQSIEIKT